MTRLTICTTLCLLTHHALAEDHLPSREAYWKLAAACSWKYAYGDTPRESGCIPSRPARPDFAGVDFGVLNDAAAKARQLMAVEDIAVRIEQDGLLQACQDPAIASLSVVQQALAQYRNQLQTLTGTSVDLDQLVPELFDDAMRQQRNEFQRQDQRFRDFHRLPAGDALSGIDAVAEGLIGLLAASVERRPSPTPTPEQIEKTYSIHAASQLYQQLEPNQMAVMDDIARHARSFAGPLRDGGLDWVLHSQSHQVFYLEAINRSGVSLHHVTVRVYSQFSAYSEGNNGTTFNLFVPEWEAGKSVILGPETLQRLTSRDTMQRRSVTSPSLAASLYCDECHLLPHVIGFGFRLVTSRNFFDPDFGRIDLHRLTSESLLQPRSWTLSVPTFEVEATLVTHDTETVTLRRQVDARTVKVPIGRLSARDRLYLRQSRDQATEGLRRWQSNPARKLRAAFASFDASPGIVLRDAAGHTQTVPFTRLSPLDRNYLELIRRLW